MRKSKKWILMLLAFINSLLAISFSVSEIVFAGLKDPIDRSLNVLKTQEILFKIASKLSCQDLEMLIKTGKIFTQISGVFLFKDTECELNLSNLHLTNKNFENFFGEKGIFRGLKKLNLSKSSFNKDLLQKLPKTLEKLNLSDTGLIDRDINSILHLENLTSLDLSNNNIGKDLFFIDEVRGTTIIACSQSMKNLKKLKLSSCRLNNRGINNIVRSPYMSNLISLDLSGNEISGVGVMAIAGSQYMQNLTSLNLSFNRIGADGIRFIANSRYMSNLTSLILIYSRIGEEGVRTITSSEYMRNLKNLNLSWNEMSQRGSYFIANSRYMSNLENLNLSWNAIDSYSVSHIAHSQYMHNLKNLDLSNNTIDQHGAKAIARSQYMANLTSLNLSHSNIGAYGAWAIAGSAYMKNLRKLDLSFNLIGEEGTEMIIWSEYMSNLRLLNLVGNGFNIDGVKAIVHSKNMKSLIELNLYSYYELERVSDEVKRTIAESLYMTNLKILNKLVLQHPLNTLQLTGTLAPFPLYPVPNQPSAFDCCSLM